MTAPTHTVVDYVVHERFVGGRCVLLLTSVYPLALPRVGMIAQVAYELLLAHNNEDLEDNESLGEFVEQCKVRMNVAINYNILNGTKKEG